MKFLAWFSRLKYRLFVSAASTSYEYQLPGPSKFPSRLVLKRGMGDVRFLWNGTGQLLRERFKRKNVTINLNDRTRGELDVLEF